MTEAKSRLKEDARRLAVRGARLLDENKLEDVSVLHVGSSLHITDYFIVATGRNRRHLKAACDNLFRELREVGIARRGVEGYREGGWVLIDFVDVVVHTFDADSRRFYDLELLWGDCPRVDWAAESLNGQESSQSPDETMRPASGDA